MKRRTLRRVGAAFGTATALGIGLTGWNANSAWQGHQAVEEAQEGDPATLNYLEYQYNDALLLVLTDVGFTALAGVGCAVSLHASKIELED